MNTLTRWNQLRQLEALQHGMGNLFSRSTAQWPEGQEEPLAVAEWAPLVDISEDDKEYRIKAELPEVKKEDVKVTAEQGTLTIMGERRFEKEELSEISDGWHERLRNSVNNLPSLWLDRFFATIDEPPIPEAFTERALR